MFSIRCQDRTFNDIRAIIFDKDGTLENSGDYLRNLAHKRSRLIDAQIPGIGEPLLMAFGVDGDRLDPTGLQAIGSRRENEIAAAAYIAETGRGWAEALDIARRAFEEADRVMASTPGSLFNGALEAIYALSGAGFKLGVLSAATTTQVIKFAEYHRLQGHFQSLLGSDGEFAKPDPRLFHQACQELGVEPSQTVMIGDGVWDMVMAQKGGAGGCIGITWGQIDRMLAGADITISHLEQLQVEGVSW
jgi:phosphoglycolate phosphatase